jgi:para-nitrobenzyl esterase
MIPVIAIAWIIGATGCGRSAPPEPPRPQAAAHSQRTTAQGDVVGFDTGEGVHVWRGIPYAAPPAGELRWRAPRPPAPWPGVRSALEFGPVCPQLAGPLSRVDVAEGTPIGEEDCLSLSIYAPARTRTEVAAAKQKLPVMLWIHGGGNTIGTGNTYDGRWLASRQNVVVVSLNYRLGIFGWLSHPALRAVAESDDDRSANFGTLDLIRALEWIRLNIAAFGGDPERVTVFGESAGGSNVFSLLLSPRARGLFHRAIAQSGSAITTTRAEAEAHVDDELPGHFNSSGELILSVLQRDGSAASREAAKDHVGQTSEADLAAYLRGKSVAEVLELFEEARLGGMYSLPRLIRDGHVIVDLSPLEAFSSRKTHNSVPTILGTNRDETKLFALFGSPHVTRIGQLPLWLNDERRYDLDAHYHTLLWKLRGVDEPATALAAAGGAPVFAYRWDWDEEGGFLMLDLSRMLGAAHGLEIPFVFGRLTFPQAGELIFPEETRPAAMRLAGAMMDYWGRFAHSGDPGRGSRDQGPEWSRWDAASADAPKFVLLDTAEGGGIRMSSASETLESVLGKVAGDPRFDDWEERCEMYASFVKRGVGARGRITPAKYGEVADGRCRSYPLGD